MGNLHFVTGYTGHAHVTAADMGSLFEALIRGGQFVMNTGANFAATVVSNNQIRVNDGELLMQGRHVKLNPGAFVDLVIENGSQGYQRNDLIVARYTKNTKDGVEDCSLVVLKGTAVESEPVDPEYVTGNINAEGATLHEFPLYRVPLSGLNVGELEALFEPQASLFEALRETATDIQDAQTAALAAKNAAETAQDAAEAAQETALAAAKHFDVLLTVPTTGWTTTTDGSYSYIDLTAGGILTTDSPIVDFDGGHSQTAAAQLTKLEWWATVFKVATSNGSIRIFATEIPTVDVPIIVKVVR